jgi:chemotaxis protein CheZ
LNTASDALAKPGNLPNETYPGERLVARVGQITRTLHDSLRELGYDKVLGDSVAKIPDTRERLAYVAAKTQQAADRALTATEIARPLQDNLAADARGLDERWKLLFENRLSIAEFKDLVATTRAFLTDVPARARATNEQLQEIMMAQDFQDLTGQVINRVNQIANDLETQLLQLLIDHVPTETRRSNDDGLMNGPVINPDQGSNALTSQGQVDDLLESLGF